MSVRLFSDDLLFEQRVLACAGFYAGKLDGIYGDVTRKAETSAGQNFLKICADYGQFDARSEKNIATLLPAMQVKARQILAVARTWEKQGHPFCSILSGTRTYAEQNALYAKRPKVTNARGGQSNHNFGIAIDVGLFDNGRYMTGARKGDDQAYSDLAVAVKAAVPGIEWGGDWKSFSDQPHYQLATGKSLAQVRELFEHGKPIV